MVRIKSHAVIPLAVVGSAATVFLFDVITPRGVVTAILYVGIVLITLWSPHRHLHVVAAALATALTLLGFVLSPAGVPPLTALPNRFLVLLAIWSTALLVQHRKRSDAESQRAKEELRRLNLKLEQHAAERTAELEKTAQELRDLYNNAPWGYHALDQDGTFIAMNDTELRWLGYRWDEIVDKKKITDLLTPEGLTALESLFPRLRQEGWVRDLEFDMVRKDGTLMHVLMNTTALRDAEGRYAMSRSTVLDLTEHKRAEEARSKLDAHIRLLLDSAGEGIYGIDLEGRCTFINKAAARLFGYEPAEVLGKPMHALIHHGQPDGSPYSEEDCPIYRSFRAGQYCRIVNEVFWRKDGTAFAAEYSSSPIIEEGRVCGAVVTFLDITERKRMETELSRQASLLDLANDSIIFRDLEDRTLVWNRAAEQRYGWTKEEAVGKVTHALLKTVFPGPPDEIRAHLLRKGRWEGDLIHTCRDGATCIVASRWALQRDANGNPTGVLEINTDITEQKRMEEMRARFAAIVESTDDAIISVDLQGTVVSWNKAAQRIFGYPAVEMIGRPLTTIIPDDRKDEERRIIARIQSGQRVEQYETIRRRKDGTPFHVSITASAIKDADGNTVGISKIARDITDRKHAEAVLNRLNETLSQRTTELETINKELEAFSYSVSHDLRAPLRHIDGFAGLLQKHAAGALDEKGRRYLATIAASAKQMGCLIDDLLVFSRMGRAELRWSVVPLAQLVREIIQDMQPDLEDRRIDWHIDPLPDVEADRAMLRQVFVNLISNAVKYTRTRTEARIEIGCRTDRHEEVVVFVRDNGVGFDMKYAHKLFGVFQRLHNQAEFEGTGIGLANVRRVIHRHGGTVWAEGSVEEGAVFYVSLPLHQPETVAHAAVVSEPIGRS